MMHLASAIALLFASGLPPPPVSGPEFLNPATARHEIILQCGASSGLVRWRVGPNFRIDAFVLDGFVASETDLAPINEATDSFGELSTVVVRCGDSRANIYIYDFSDPGARKVRLFGFAGRGFYPILSRP